MKQINFFLIAVSVIILMSCQTSSGAVQEPTFSIQSVDVVNRSLTGARLLCRMEVKNPNSFDIPFPDTDWRLFLNNNSFSSGTVNKVQRIKARGSSVIDLPVDVSYLNVFNTFASFRGRQSIDYRLALDVKIPIPVFGEKIWSLEKRGELPLPQSPRMTNPSVRIGNINRSGAEVFINLDVENPNPFPLPSPKINYSFVINRNPFIRGEISNKPLAASSITPIELKLQVSFIDLFRSYAALASSREAACVFTYSCDFGIPALSGNIINREIPVTLPLR